MRVQKKTLMHENSSIDVHLDFVNRFQYQIGFLCRYRFRWHLVAIIKHLSLLWDFVVTALRCVVIVISTDRFYLH